ncbi:hypothetical protein EDD86DRAFT_245857 [Gorgonomyces haynaldii]|nr:hypothetical protein EDD86DRAFT_245857 [Gorgonomyces haynaldii]
MYRVAESNEFLVKTGFGVPDIQVIKKGFFYPGQIASRFSVSPVNYTINITAMTAEKLEVMIPGSFTIGPAETKEGLLRFARLLAGNKHDKNYLSSLVMGVIEGETRLIIATMTIEEIFKERKLFKEHVLRNIQGELEQFGMIIYNANVKELQDAPGSEYFKYLRLKSHEGAINQAKIDVAQAKFKGTVGEKEREGEQRKVSSKIEADAVAFEQANKANVFSAESKLAVEKTNFDNQVALAKIEADKKAQMRDADLQRELEVKRAMVLQEKERAEKLSLAMVEKEKIQTLADAALYKAKTEADAALYKKQKQAEAELVMLQAQAQGLHALGAAFGGDSKALLQYLMLEKGLYQDLAKANAEAIKGLEPKITVWNTGSGEGQDAGKAIRDIFQTLPPLFTTINEQTGIAPPQWMAQMPKASSNATLN